MMWLVSFYMEWERSVRMGYCWALNVKDSDLIWRWAGFVSASTGYSCCRLLYVCKEKEARKEELRRGVGWVWLWKPKGILAFFALCVLWETRSERHWTHFTDHVTHWSGPHSHRIFLVSIKRKDMHINVYVPTNLCKHRHRLAYLTQNNKSKS